ncbi:MAG: hypothetical protein WC775_00145 [Patescibacteria group bacterium]|jgi:hypothetical protein
MSSVDFREFHRHKAEPTERYFQNPYMFWRDFHYGATRQPSPFVTDALPASLSMKGLSTELKQEIARLHDPQQGTTIHTAILPNYMRAITIVNTYGSPFGNSFIPGLRPKSDPRKEPWEYGLTKADAYYFAPHNELPLVSLHDLARSCSDVPISVYLYGDMYPHQTSQALYLEDPQKGWYYAVLTHAPRNLSHILSALHEIGHVALDAQDASRWDELLAIAGISNVVKEYDEKWDRISNSNLSILAKRDSLMNLMAQFRQSDAGMRKMGAEMIYEYEVWGATIPLLEQCGMLEVFKDAPKTLIDFIFWAIKTRLG